MGWLGRLRPAGAAVTLNVVFPRIGISLMGRPPRQFHGLVELVSVFHGFSMAKIQNFKQKLLDKRQSLKWPWKNELGWLHGTYTTSMNDCCRKRWMD